MRRNLFSLIVPLLCPAMLLAQTETEPNDNIAQANTLTLGTAMSGDIGATPCGSGTSDDYFMLNLTQDGSIDINTNAANTGASVGTLRVLVFNSGGGQIFYTDHAAGANSTPTSVTSTHTCLNKGTYYFALQRLSNDCYTYALTITQTTPVYGDDPEPNNSFADANANPLLAANTTTDGHINFSYYVDNSDYYRIHTANDGVLNVTISAESPNAASTVRVLVYNSGGGQINYFDATIGGGSVPTSTTSSFTCYAQDYYYFAVQSLGACGVSYRLSYTLTPPMFANDAEPDNSFPTALPLALNTFTEGHLNFANVVDNDDRYVVSTPVEGTMTVTLIAENATTTDGTVRVYVFNSGGGQIDYFDATAGGNSTATTTSASFNCYGQGTYYIAVQTIGGCGVSYKLKYQSTGAVFTNDTEPDNSFADAVANGVLPPNTFTEGHINFNHYGDNADYYYAQTPAEGTMNVTLIAERVPGVDGTVRVYVYNGGGGQIDYFDATAGGNSAAATTNASFNCYGQGDYYFAVQSIGGCGISYKLKYTITPAVYANDVEPDNSLAQALADPLLAPNVYTEGHINFNHYGDNADYYAIQTADDGTLNLTMIAERVPATDGTLRVYVYNSGGGQINYFDAVAGGGSAADTTTASFTCYQQGTYYLAVQSIGGCGISYKLGYTLTPPIYGNDIEPDNALSSAIALNPDSANTTGHLNFANGGDNGDYFRVMLPGTASIQFDFLAEAAGAGTIRIYLYNGGGGQINYQDVPVGASHLPATTAISFGPYAAGTYYMLVQSLGGCGISYRFNCNDADGDGVCNYFDLCPGGPEPGTACNDNSACTINDVIGANCICAGTFQDADGDGTCDVNDGCPNDPNKIAPGTCGCGNPEPGSLCDDGNPNTTNDAIGANCVCAGTLLGNDCLGVPGGSALPGTLCDDGNACTLNDTWSNACVCVGTPMVCNDNNTCTSDACVNGMCVYTPLPDSDGDGTCDATDGCPNDPNKIAPGTCGCGNPEPGAVCNDNNACTINDVIGANCVCVGTPMVCNDNNPCTSDACVNGQCVYTPLPDTDGDGICDAQDNCPNVTGMQGSPCNDNNVCTINDVLNAGCVCVGTFQDSDGDGVCDANDNCPNNVGQIGSPCNDNDPNTVNDVLDQNCVCMGTQNGGCTQHLTLSIKLDGNPGQTTWRLYNAAENTIVQQGGPFTANQANTTVAVPICVIAGCYHLRVYDSGGNGITGGGYTLVDAANHRIIDASLGTFTSLSEIDNIGVNRAFCVPLGALGMQTSSCDKSQARTSPIHCSTQPGAAGYQFWLYDPHGTYNRRVLKPTNSLTPSSLVTFPVPSNVNLNVRVRALIGLVYSEFGPACRVKFTGTGGFVPGDGEHNREMDDVVTSTEVSLSLFPNPNRDGLVTLMMDNIEAPEGSSVDIDVYDMTGQRVHAEHGVAVESMLNHTLDLSGKARAGIYLVNVTMGDQRYMQRLVME